jgi:hypothetical protein
LNSSFVNFTIYMKLHMHQLVKHLIKKTKMQNEMLRKLIDFKMRRGRRRKRKLPDIKISVTSFVGHVAEMN